MFPASADWESVFPVSAAGHSLHLELRHQGRHCTALHRAALHIRRVPPATALPSALPLPFALPQGRHTDRLLTVCYLPVNLATVCTMVCFHRAVRPRLRIQAGLGGFTLALTAVTLVRFMGGCQCRQVVRDVPAEEWRSPKTGRTGSLRQQDLAQRDITLACQLMHLTPCRSCRCTTARAAQPLWPPCWPWWRPAAPAMASPVGHFTAKQRC